MPRVRRVAAAWAFALACALLLVASLTGNGDGLFGLGLLEHPLWSWAVLLVGGVLFPLLLLPEEPRRGDARAEVSTHGGD